MFEKGKEYKRSDLHAQFGGQRQGGISTPRNFDFVMLFATDTGEQHGYSDGWHGEGFYYTGEGQRGDMMLKRGNRAVHDHTRNGKRLLLFSQTRKGFVRFDGEMECIGYHTTQGRDSSGLHREMIVFELRPISSK